MPLYEYDGYTKAGKKVSGTTDAPTEGAARERLKGQGLIPARLKETSASAAASGFSLSGLFAPRVDQKTVILFTKQLAVLLKAGVPLLQSFELLEEQFEGPFKNILLSMQEGLKGGESLASLLSQHPHVFSNVYIQLVRAGEASGKLDEILERLKDFLERSAETSKKVNEALRGPLMNLVMIFGITVGMMVGVVPRMAEMFNQMGKELPTATTILIASSDFLIANYLFLLGALIIGIIAFMQWRATEGGRRALDELILRLPLFSHFSKTQAVVQFCQTLGMLIESGVNLSEALDIVTQIVDNSVLTQKLKAAQDNIIKEGKIARYLEETGIFPKMASYMIKTGEESGKLGEMLTSVGHDYDVELQDLTKTLTAAVNPIMQAVLTMVVLFMIAAILTPIMQMNDMSGM